MHLELIFAESAFNKTCLYRRVRAPITKTRPNNTRQRAKSKKSATPTSKGKFYENADSANINVRRTVVEPPLTTNTPVLLSLILHLFNHVHPRDKIINSSTPT